MSNLFASISANQLNVRVDYASASNARNGHAEASGKSGVEFSSQSYAKRHRNLHAEPRKVLSKPEAFSITQDKWAKASARAFQEHIGDDKHAVKRLGRILECSPRTAENLYLGRTTPSGIHFLRAYAMVPEFAAEVRRLTNMEASLDPTFERDLAQFMSRASAHLEKRGG